MPEGYLLHRYARDHQATLAGEALRVTSPQGRFEDARRLDGRVLLRAEAFGKHLFHRWDDGSVVHVHLGQRGVFLHHDPPAPDARPQVRMRIAGSRRVVDLIAPARCDRLTSAEAGRVVARLGPDPLRADADREAFVAGVAARRAPIGALLLDQSLVAGVGNVLRAEALFLCGISPERPGAELAREELEALWSTLEALMSRAVEDGRILPHVPAGADRASIAEQETRFVYRQPRCRRCGSPVRTATIGGRTSYWCERDQL